MTRLPDQAKAAIDTIYDYKIYGSVTKILGLLIEVAGVSDRLSIGSHVHLTPKDGRAVPCEVIGFKDDHALGMPFGTVDGIGLGCQAVVQQTKPVVYPDETWLGRVINALGEPIDGKGPIINGAMPIPLRNTPPPPHQRKRLSLIHI